MLLLEDRSEEKGNEIYEYCAFMLLFADRFEGKGNQNYRFQVLGCLSKLSPKYFPKNVYLKKKLYDYSKQRENGVTYYWGTAAKITIKGGKVVKIQQVYQA